VLPGFARATAVSDQPCNGDIFAAFSSGCFERFFSSQSNSRATALKSRWYVGSGSQLEALLWKYKTSIGFFFYYYYFFIFIFFFFFFFYFFFFYYFFLN